MPCRWTFSFWSTALIVVAVCAAPLDGAAAAELLIGGATTTITPDQPVALSGQRRTRIAREVESPCTATVLALEAREGERVVDQAIMVSCDLVAIRRGILDLVRERVAPRLEGFDVNKVFLNATHTHTAPVMRVGRYDIPSEGVMKPAEYRTFLADQLAGAIVRAWNSRAPGSVGWGLGHAVVAHNRRINFADGSAQMYGSTNRPDFRHIEGYEDHGVEVLFFWDKDRKLIATAINVACPSQEVEGLSVVNADFWHPLRQMLRERHGKDLFVLGWTGAAGDQSPHLMYRKRAEERMRELRGLTRLEELARRIVQAWEEAYAGASQEIQSDVVMTHKVQTIELPGRLVTEKEYQDAKAQVEKFLASKDDPRRGWSLSWHGKIVDRYEQQQKEAPVYSMEMHVIRLGDVAIATNDFELFTDFGLRMKARSKALQTFVIQLAGPGSYVPTERAVRGGGYSAVVQSSVVGPRGGRVLVERTVETINSLWPAESSP